MLATLGAVATLTSSTVATGSTSTAPVVTSSLSPAHVCASAVLGPIADTVEEAGVTDDPYDVPRYIKQKGDQLDSTYGQDSAQTAAYTAAMGDLTNYLYQQGEQHDVVSNAEAGRLNQIAEWTCQRYAGRLPTR